MVKYSFLVLLTIYGHVLGVVHWMNIEIQLLTIYGYVLGVVVL